MPSDALETVCSNFYSNILISTARSSLYPQMTIRVIPLRSSEPLRSLSSLSPLLSLSPRL